MKSIRLNKSSREGILESMMTGFVDNWFKKNAPDFTCKQDLVKRGCAVREETMKGLWMAQYGPYQQMINKLPEKLLSDSGFTVTVEGGHLTEGLDLKGYPGKRSAVDVMLTQDEWDGVFAPYYELRNLISKFECDCSKFRNEVWQILESVSTTGKLVEVWPASEQYIPAYLNEPSKGINLPVLHTSRLDEALGVSNA